MDERTMQLRLGAAVLASLVIVVIMLVLLGSHKNLFSSKYNIYIVLNDAPGVVEGTPIHQSGILIGRVKRVDLVRDDEKAGVRITASIDGKHTLYRNQQCQLSSTLLGDASLKMVRIPHEPGDPPLSDKKVEPGETIEGKIAFDPVALIGKFQEKVAVAIADVSRAASQLEKVAGSAGEMMQENRQNIKATIQSTSDMIADSHAFVKDLSTLVGDEELQESLRTTIVRLPQTMDKMDATVDSLRTNINDSTGRMNDTMEQMAGKMEHSLGLADKALANVLKITDPLATKTEIWLGNIDNILQNLDVFTDTMVDKNGTVGLLLRDRTAYDKLFQTMDRVNYLTQQLEPIVYNAQVFSEKIAQHPELLGVRGALFPNSGATGKDVPPPRGVRNYGSTGSYGDLNFYNTTQSPTPAPPPAQAPCAKTLKPAVPHDQMAHAGLPEDVFREGHYEIVSDAPVAGSNPAPAGSNVRLKPAVPSENRYPARVAL